MEHRPRVYFGGPDQPARLLRDELERRVDAVPAGGAIHWMTYYFRDERLADSLVRAHRRGVAVKLCLEGSPRHRGANDRVIAILRGERGIGSGLKVVRHWLTGNLHTKLYCFSDPQPVALIGSFNPSGNEPEDPAVVSDIGDQDRGHNLLVELSDPLLVEACVERASAIHAGAGPYGALAMAARSTAVSDGNRLFFFPRFGRNPLDDAMASLPRDSRLRIAASHIRDRHFLALLARLVERGVDVTVLTHHTLRRTPERTAQYLRGAGVRVYRYEHPDELPMHDKYILAEGPAGRWSAFGSYNFKRRSRWLNQELLAWSQAPELWRQLNEHWKATIAEPWCKG